MRLDEMLARTRLDLADRMRQVPRATLDRSVRPSDRSLAAALRHPHAGFILECKRAAPSTGLLVGAYDPKRIAAAYAPFADAVSVLTDGPFFRGTHEHLDLVRTAVPLPVLCKDFVVDPYQVIEARVHGADAVLLMLSLLDDAAWTACAGAARAVGLETLTEVHDEDELRRAIALDAPIIGINNRDLRTMEVDLEVTARLAPLVPPDRLLVGESGIRTHAEAHRLGSLVDALLVGTSLMRETDLPGAVRRLVFGITKVCGLTRVEDARDAWAAGATHGGLILTEESPRRVTESAANAIRSSAPLAWVGVFVNAAPEEVTRAAEHLRLSAVQLHGEESPAQVRDLRSRLPEGCEVWKAVRVRERVPRLDETGADRLVIDAWHPDQRGGTGLPVDWSLVAGHPDRARLILGGGLSPGNAAAADALDLWGLDVNSGVETAPGIKSQALLSAFFHARRGRGREPA
jgi:indole-3-glycerol phosphate synthase / phosphoribosylanthranilate isomerase